MKLPAKRLKMASFRSLAARKLIYGAHDQKKGLAALLRF